ncbi:MAG TPA: LptF/LptG family permease [Gemmatimonadaceae bacterium]|nr:LptF/LptG family permease [Gemmatimonadaceae bacterium]
MKILSKYVLRQHVGPFLFAMTALTSLLLLNYITKQFGRLVGKGLPWSVIAEFFMLAVPFTVAMTLPMAVLVATLYAFSHLAAENEITALKAGGVSMMRLLLPVLVGGAVITGFMVFFNDQVLPRANHRLRILQSDILRVKPTFALREQVINEVTPGRLFLRAGHIDEGSSGLREVVIYDLSDPQSRRTIYADSGVMGLSPDQRDLILTLYDGHMQEVSKRDPSQLQRLFYRVDRIRIPGVGNQLERSENDTYKSDREMSICEMQKEYQTAEQAKRRAQAELRYALREGTRQALTGTPPRPFLPTRDRPGVGLAPMYCALLGGVPEASAARPPSLGRPPTPVDGVGGPVVPLLSPHLPGPVALNQSVLGARTRAVEAERQMDIFGVEIEKKFSLSVACIVFVLLGAPVAVRFPRGGVGLVISVSLVAFGIYYIGLIAGESVADRNFLSPFWAMWAANLVFGVAGALLVARMGREQATARGGDAGEAWLAFRLGFARQARRFGIPLDRRAPA